MCPGELCEDLPALARSATLFGSALGFDRLAFFSIDHPGRVICAFIALVLLAAPGLFRLQLRTDGHALVPPDDPAVRFDAEVRRHFGLRDPIVVVLDTGRPDGIFNPRTLRRLRDLTAALEKVPGVPPGGVTSLATEKRDRVYPGTLDFRPFLDEVPETPEQMAIFQGDLEAIGILHGTLVSQDRSAAAVLVGAPNVLEGLQGANAAAADRVALCGRITETARRFGGPGNRILVVGAPVAEALLGTHILRDLAVLLPLSIAIISFVLWLGCRRMAGVLLGMAQLAAAQTFTFGLMGWLGIPAYLTTAVLPVILTTLALADEIHLFWRYQQILGPEPGEADARHPQAVRTLLAQMGRPIVLATVTTIIGFLSFLSSPLVAVRSFGAFAAVGLLFCLFWSLMVGPASLALLSPRALRRPVHESGVSDGPSERSRRFFAPLYRAPRRTLAVLTGATLLVSLGIVRLQVQDSWLGGFAPGSPFRTATERVNRLFNGTHLLLVHLDLSGWKGPLSEVYEGEPGPLVEPRALNAIGNMEAFLKRQPRVGGVLGPYAQMTTVSFLRSARQPERMSIPRTSAEVANLVQSFDDVRGETRRREVIDDTRRRGVITLFLKDPDYRQVAKLMADTRRYARERLEPLGIRIGFAGDVAVSQAMIPAIVRTQVFSLPLAQLGSWLIVALLYRSWKVGLLIALPSSVAVAWMLGAMGWTGIPLGVATAMFCSITLGVGIDYGIHFYEVFLRLRREGESDAALAAVSEAGPAIVADTAAIALGFGILVISRVPSNARLGFLVAGALAVACALTLVGLGTLLDHAALREKRG